MPRRERPIKTVETLKHEEATRKNIPTAEYQSVLQKKEQDPVRVAYERRNRDLDPQLVWRGKDEQDWSDLVVHAPPLYIQEKVHPKVLIDDLLRATKQHEHESGELTPDLFADFNGIAKGVDKTEFYQHDQNWSNRMILGDSLQVMASLAEREGLRGKVQCIYIDPPYGIKFNSNFQWSTTSRDVKDGNAAHITREPEQVKAFRDTWRDGIHSYLTYLRDRFTVAQELLAESGSIFVQIGDENVHRVRTLLDEIFGDENFAALITFRKKMMPLGSDVAEGISDYLLWYAKDRPNIKTRPLFYSKEVEGSHAMLPDGRRIAIVSPTSLPQGAVLYDSISLLPAQYRKNQDFNVNFEGKTWPPPKKNSWKTDSEGMHRLLKANRLHPSGSTLRYMLRHEDYPVGRITNLWSDAAGATQQIYVVQTNVDVVKRCLLMTTDPGDLVLDPTCGSGTTAYVAEQWGRRWITIDTSRVPLALTRQRLLTATYPYFELGDPARGPAAGFVYRQKQNLKGEEVGGIVPHMTLRSVAQSEPPNEEVVVDRPEIEPGIVRVAGPFVAEATIPTTIEVTVPAKETEADYASDPISRMIEVLRRSPALRIGGKQAVTLKNIRRPAKALSLHAEAEVDGNGTRPVAFVFGPEHGPVTEQLVFAAAKEANLKNYAHLYVIGFAIQPGASRLIQGAEQMVGVPATYVQATMDLLMGDLLKTTRASQIFSVTGSPDVRLIRLKRKNGNGPLYWVELLGLDVFDPVSMQTDHRKGDDVPAWFLDTDYDDLVFHVAQAFFPRTSAWDALKRALRATYDESVS